MNIELKMILKIFFSNYEKWSFWKNHGNVRNNRDMKFVRPDARRN